MNAVRRVWSPRAGRDRDRAPPTFEPGPGWAYSDTGSRRWSDDRGHPATMCRSSRERSRTSGPDPHLLRPRRSGIAGYHAHGTCHVAHRRGYQDITRTSPSIAWTAGGIVDRPRPGPVLLCPAWRPATPPQPAGSDAENRRGARRPSGTAWACTPCAAPAARFGDTTAPSPATSTFPSTIEVDGVPRGDVAHRTGWRLWPCQSHRRHGGVPDVRTSTPGLNVSARVIDPAAGHADETVRRTS